MVDAKPLSFLDEVLKAVPQYKSNLVSYLDGDHSSPSNPSQNGANDQTDRFYEAFSRFCETLGFFFSQVTIKVADSEEEEKNYPLNDKIFFSQLCRHKNSVSLVLQYEESLYPEWWNEQGLAEGLQVRWIFYDSLISLWVEIPLNLPNVDSFLQMILSPTEHITKINVFIMTSYHLINKFDELLDKANRNRPFESKKHTKLVKRIYNDFQKWCPENEPSNGDL